MENPRRPPTGEGRRGSGTVSQNLGADSPRRGLRRPGAFPLPPEVFPLLPFPASLFPLLPFPATALTFPNNQALSCGCSPTISQYQSTFINHPHIAESGCPLPCGGVAGVTGVSTVSFFCGVMLRSVSSVSFERGGEPEGGRLYASPPGWWGAGEATRPAQSSKLPRVASPAVLGARQGNKPLPQAGKMPLGLLYGFLVPRKGLLGLVAVVLALLQRQRLSGYRRLA